MIDIAAEREAFKHQEISGIGFVWSGNNVSDRLAKSMKQLKLRNKLYGTLSIQSEQ